MLEMAYNFFCLKIIWYYNFLNLTYDFDLNHVILFINRASFFFQWNGSLGGSNNIYNELTMSWSIQREVHRNQQNNIYSFQLISPS